MQFEKLVLKRDAVRPRFCLLATILEEEKTELVTKSTHLGQNASTKTNEINPMWSAKSFKLDAPLSFGRI